jgi:hypothetical protein
MHGVQFSDSIGLPTDEGIFGFKPFGEVSTLATKRASATTQASAEHRDAWQHAAPVISWWSC